MRRKTGLCFWLVAIHLIAGCSEMANHRVVLIPIDEQTVLDAHALLLVNANAGSLQRPEQGDDGRSPSQCLCGGTGRSGDGLGPCACPDGCRCRPTRQDSPDDKVLEFSESKADTVPEDVVRVIETVSVLASNQEKMVGTVDDLQKRIEALEQACNASTSAAAAAAADSVIGFTEPEADVVITARMILVSSANCLPCDRMKKHAIPQLLKQGWKVGDTNDCHIHLVNVSDMPQSEAAREAIAFARRHGTPALAYVRDGRVEKYVVGETSAKEIADELNAIATGKSDKSAQGGDSQARVFLYDGGRKSRRILSVAPLMVHRAR